MESVCVCVCVCVCVFYHEMYLSNTYRVTLPVAPRTDTTTAPAPRQRRLVPSVPARSRRFTSPCLPVPLSFPFRSFGLEVVGVDATLCVVILDRLLQEALLEDYFCIQ